MAFKAFFNLQVYLFSDICKFGFLDIVYIDIPKDIYSFFNVYICSEASVPSIPFFFQVRIIFRKFYFVG